VCIGKVVDGWYIDQKCIRFSIYRVIQYFHLKNVAKIFAPFFVKKVIKIIRFTLMGIELASPTLLNLPDRTVSFLDHLAIDNDLRLRLYLKLGLRLIVRPRLSRRLRFGLRLVLRLIF
jgi:hypothetical protein